MLVPPSVYPALTIGVVIELGVAEVAVGASLSSAELGRLVWSVVVCPSGGLVGASVEVGSTDGGTLSVPEEAGGWSNVGAGDGAGVSVTRVVSGSEMMGESPGASEAPGPQTVLVTVTVAGS